MTSLKFKHQLYGHSLPFTARDALGFLVLVQVECVWWGGGGGQWDLSRGQLTSISLPQVAYKSWTLPPAAALGNQETQSSR